MTMNKRKAILSIALCLTSLAVTAQQKLSITHDGQMFTDIMLYGADGKAHQARAMISTAVESCVIDSAFYHSTLKGKGKGKKDYVGGEFGKVIDVTKTTLDSLSFDGRAYRGVTAIVAPLIDKKPYDVAIGASILDGQTWLIDMKDSLMTRIEQPAKGQIATIDCLRGNKKAGQSYLMYIPLKVQGKSFDCLFHTGANGIAITKKIAGQPWIAEVFEGSDGGYFHYNARHQYRLPNAKVKVPYTKWEITETVKYVPMLNYNCVGNILFGGHTYVLDYRKNRILIY